MLHRRNALEEKEEESSKEKEFSKSSPFKSLKLLESSKNMLNYLLCMLDTILEASIEEIKSLKSLESWDPSCPNLFTSSYSPSYQ